MPPIPQNLPLDKEVEREEILDSMTKEQLKQQILLMQEQQQILLKQQSDMRTMLNSRGSVVSVPMLIPTARSTINAQLDRDPLSEYSRPYPNDRQSYQQRY